MYRLLTNEDADTDIFELNAEQKEAIEKDQKQYRDGQLLSQEQADKDFQF